MSHALTQFERIKEGLARLANIKAGVAYTYQEGLLVCLPDGVTNTPALHMALLGLGWHWCADYDGYYFPLSPL